MKKLGVLFLVFALVLVLNTIGLAAGDRDSFTVTVNVQEFMKVVVPENGITLNVTDPTTTTTATDNVTVLANFDGGTVTVSSDGFNDFENVSYELNDNPLAPGASVTLSGVIGLGSNTMIFDVIWNGLSDGYWETILADSYSDTVLFTVSSE